MLLTGSFRRSLDDKGRLLLPKQLRQEMALGEGSRLFLTPGNDGALALYRHEELMRFGRSLAEASPGVKEVRSYLRLFYARSQGVEIDRNGRIRIPAELAHLASLGSEVMLLGVGDHVELWNHDSWQNFVVQTQPEFDSMTEAAFRTLRRTNSLTAFGEDESEH